jgi:hypothetical protein
MSTDESTRCNITNLSGKDTVIAVAPRGQEKTIPDAFTTFNQQLELLTFAGGGTVLKNGATDAVILDENNLPAPGQDGPVKNHDLIVSESTWLYPLVHLDISQNGGNSYPPQTVAATSLEAMNQAINFYQVIAVYPDSQLASDYMKVLASVKAAAMARADGSSGSAQAVADAIENTVSDFFKTTKEYKDVTLTDVVAVNNYYASFPFVWAQYKDSITYYLYGSDGETATFAGTLSLQKSAADGLLKPNGGYTCLFVPAVNPADTGKTDTDSSKAVPLTYTNGLFVDDAKSATPKIALKGSFLLKQFFTTKEEDTQVITVVAGRCNGLRCIGFDVPQPAKAKQSKALAASSPVERYWNALVHPKSQLDMLISILTFVGAVAFIAINALTIYKIHKWVKARKEAAKALSGDDLNDNWEHVDEDSGEESELYFGEYTGDDLGWKKVDFSKVREELALDRLQMMKGKLVEGLEAQGRSIEGILDFFRLMRTSDVVEAQAANAQIDKSIDALNEASPANLKEVVAREYQSFSERQPKITKVLSNASNVITEEAKSMVQNGLDISSEVIDKVKDMQQEDDADYDYEKEEEFTVDPIRPWQWK